MPEILAIAFDGVAAYSFVRQEAHSYSVFGGPSDCKIVGTKFRSVQLHQIARLSSHHLPLLDGFFVFDLPLVYGMRYGGGSLTYQFEHAEITILEMSDKKCRDDFPYRDFPAILPFGGDRNGALYWVRAQVEC